MCFFPISRFIRNPELGSVLLEIQSLLPLFTPSDINAVLVVKNSFDGIPGANKVMEKLLQVCPKIMLFLHGYMDMGAKSNVQVPFV